jgi:hypothetical protein
VMLRWRPNASSRSFANRDATISGRINSLRAASQGEGQSLTQREAHGLAGEWYLWFVSLHEDEPGTAEAGRSRLSA